MKIVKTRQHPTFIVQFIATFFEPKWPSSGQILVPTHKLLYNCFLKTDISSLEKASV